MSKWVFSLKLFQKSQVRKNEIKRAKTSINENQAKKLYFWKNLLKKLLTKANKFVIISFVKSKSIFFMEESQNVNLHGKSRNT